MAKLTPTAGLKLEPDTAPHTSGTMSAASGIIDGVLYTAATGAYWYTHYSYGIDLGAEQTVEKLTVSCNPGPVTPTSWYSSSHDSLAVYKSSDGSSWTQVQQFDGPSITHSGNQELGFDLVFSTAQAARYFKVVYIDSTTLAVNPGGASCKVGEIEAYGEGEETALEDVSLDLAAYYQDLQDLKSLLQAHDGSAVEDLLTTLAAAGLDIEDLAAALAAYYQDMDDLPAQLQTLGQGVEDFRAPLAAFVRALYDVQASLSAMGQGFEDLRLHPRAAGYDLPNLKVALSATDGSVLLDLVLMLAATDGLVTDDFAVYLAAIREAPSYTAQIGQRVSSVVTEVT